MTAKYETVAASQTLQGLGSVGNAGDYLDYLMVVPSSVSPGAIVIGDGDVSITVFEGGANSLSNLVPFMIPLGLTSQHGPWTMTTGVNLSVIALGNFT